MPAALSYPGVYVEELPSGVRTITGVATSVAAFIGRARRGPVDEAVDITGFGDFERIFGGLWEGSSMSFAVRDFFLNGGARAVIVRLFNDGGSADASAAVASIVEAARGSADGKAAKAAAKGVNDPIQADAEKAQLVKDAAKAANDAIATLTDTDDAAAVATKLEEVEAAAPDPPTRTMKVSGLTFKAASPGAWAGKLRILITPANSATSKDVADRLGVADGDLFNLTIADLSPGGATEVFENLTLKDSVRRVDLVLENSNLIAWAGGDPTTLTMPDLETVYGDDVGQTYVELAKLRKDNPVPADDATKTKIKEAETNYDNALKAAATSASDGSGLEATDFLKVGGEDAKTGLYALEQLYTRDGIFNLLCIPPYNADDNTDTGVIAAAGAYCEKRRAILLVDPPSGWKSVRQAMDGFSADPDQLGYRGRNAAIFFPRLRMPNPLHGNRLESFASCGVAAGLFARTDTERGVWKSPAGIDTSLLGVASLTVPMTDAENGLLNPLGINCMRRFPIFGAINWGARTLRGADAFADEYKYVAVRRTALYIEESLYRALKWVVFEPNDEPLWAQIRLNVGAFMHNLFRQRAFQGQSANEAYFVKCDAETTTQNDINLGIVNIKVGFAPLKPAEFVVIQLQQIAGSIEA
jgi:phage tail sheath protein FI